MDLLHGTRCILWRKILGEIKNDSFPIYTSQFEKETTPLSLFWFWDLYASNLPLCSFDVWSFIRFTPGNARDGTKTIASSFPSARNRIWRLANGGTAVVRSFECRHSESSNGGKGPLDDLAAFWWNPGILEQTAWICWGWVFTKVAAFKSSCFSTASEMFFSNKQIQREESPRICAPPNGQTLMYQFWSST